jgi:dTDP-4-dehydrorhamnose 3,5-epimerase
MFSFQKLELEGLYLITPKVFADERGFFMESYKKSEFYENGITQEFCQDNHSRSKKGVLRGLHYQEGEYAQGKLVRCVRGEIFDVAVDIRRDSATYGQWYGVSLSEDNHQMLYIPVGFAHGFYTVSEEAEVLYKTTFEYVAEADRGIVWNDPFINVAWPCVEPILSEKDGRLPRIE